MDRVVPAKPPSRSPLSPPLAPERRQASDYRPLGQMYRVQVTETDEKSPGGIWLPDNYQSPWNEGLVLAAGPGRQVPASPSERSVMWADVGDKVLFLKHGLRHVRDREGLVKDEDVVAVVRLSRGESEPEPLNDWCMVEQDPDVEMAGALIVHAEEWRPKPMSGTLVDFGPGEVRAKGPLAGTRRSCGAIWGLGDDGADDVKGKRCYWDSRCEVLAVGRSHLEFLLIKAGDLYAIEG